MKKIKFTYISYIIVFALLMFVLQACTSFTSSAEKRSIEVSHLLDDNLENVRAYITGTVDSLGYLEEDQKTKETILAESLAKKAQSLAGAPRSGNRIIVAGLLSNDPIIQKQAREALEARDKKAAATQEELNKKKKELDKINAELQKMGKLYEEERNKNIVSRIWNWAIGTFGLIGGIAFIIFCPAIALPILGFLLKTIIGMIPHVMNFVGVVGSSVVENIVSGVGNFRWQIKASPEDKTFTKKEVMDMINSHLKETTTRDDKFIIDYIRKMKNVD